MNRITNATSLANQTTRGLQNSQHSTFNYAGAALSPQRHTRLMEKLRSGSSDRSSTYDLVVVGAGVTGAGVALDAATRGLSVLLVDKEDLAFGTSRWSSKLAHGGLRYLASGNVGIARRNAAERGILMEVTAPHLTRALGQVVPVMSAFSALNNVLPRLGFVAGDALRIAAGTSGKTLPHSRTISARRVAELCPAVDRHNVKFGYLNYDGQLIDDAALVTALARTAGGFGADVLTHCRVESVDELPADRVAHSGSANAAVSLNVEGETLVVHAAAVVNATGVWAGDLDETVKVTPSRGTHLVVDAEKLGYPEGALTVPVPGATNRFCFILPTQLGRCYIGLTDEQAQLEDVPTAPEEDVQWILDVVNQALLVDLTADDVIGTFAGLRPLVEIAGPGKVASNQENGTGGERHTADLPREHAILVRGPMVTVTGGKLTEYRLMAEQTVDRVLAEGLIAKAKIGPCVTKQTPLIGAPTRPEQAAQLTSSDASEGSAATAETNNNADQGSLIARPDEPVVPGLAVTRGRLSFAVTHEGARTISDILDRRTRIGLVPADRAAAEPVAREVLQAAGLK
ncbi:glycerol-3-phosphate dehydrogenase/oxidase [uncultured Corynebacterium sp.]|uniref:glycerol-3-phosphate dehydrogenase/oxidase n=1 Tax=uncultured Corynebacterium sp. TaxID=159447 RepID=UPI0025D82F28|nr:glycerol-3-phosphate dehydrogenase/oxidase [uncultured Corynebacterium sp.]